MSTKPKRRLRPAAKALIYSLSLALCAGALYGTIFVFAYSKQDAPQNRPEPSAPTASSIASSQESSQSVQSEDSSQPEPAAWPEGTDYGYPMPDLSVPVSKTILLDAGHGGSDGGHIAADGTLEKNLTLDLCRKIKAHLELQNPNLNVVMLRDSDDISEWSTSSWADLSYRMQAQSKCNADYVLSMHVNSYDDPAQQGYLFYLNEDDPMSQALASDISANLQQAGFSQDLGVITMDEYPLQTVLMSNAHSMQIELGALSNEQDLAMLEDPETSERLCAGIASALSNLISSNPDAPAYQSRQKDVANKLEQEKARRAEEERKRAEEEARKKEEEEKKKQEEERRKAAGGAASEQS